MGQKSVNSPKRTTDDRLPAPALRKSRTQDDHSTQEKAWKRSQNRLHSRWSDGGVWRLETNPAAARTRTHTQMEDLFKPNESCVCVNIGCFGCGLCTSASSTRWPSLPSAPIGTGGRTCKSNLPIDVFQKRKGNKGCLFNYYIAPPCGVLTTRKLLKSLQGSFFVLKELSKRGLTEAKTRNIIVKVVL